jgi:murein DD-endopeptidase MepM/ murein hydrolase activator NlpD
MLLRDPTRVGALAGGPRRALRRRRRSAALVALGALVLLVWWLRTPSTEPGDGERDAERDRHALRTLSVPPLFFDQVDDVRWEAAAFGSDRRVTPAHVRGTIESGVSLTAALARGGVPAAQIGPPVAALSRVYDFRRSQPGHTYEADLDPSGRVLRLRYQTRPELAWEARWRPDEGWTAGPVEFPIETHTRVLSGRVTSSFIAAVVEAGARDALAQKVVDVFQWDIDFSRQVQPGDVFRMVYEEVLLDGRFLRYGRVLAAEYRGRSVRADAFWFDDEAHAGYYSRNGERLERMFLAAPCRYRRISSRFDPNRIHPVLGVRRPHLGVDYAAPPGTPVHAVADGHVLFVGVRGGNGNLVTLRHDHGYESGYAHLQRFARGLRRGDRVRQGQLIGYVGSTGLSTGPHLHFGLKRNGTWIDPLAAEQTRGPPLSGRALREFQRRTAERLASLESVPLDEVELVAEEVAGDEEFNEEDFVHEF